MRIISGVAKGKKIKLPVNKKTRPLKDMVRESIFNILDHSTKFSVRINNAKVLDLFSGTGSFGFECISRGSKKITNLCKKNHILVKYAPNVNSSSNLEVRKHPLIGCQRKKHMTLHLN